MFRSEQFPPPPSTPWKKKSKKTGFLKKIQAFIENPSYINLTILGAVVVTVFMLSYRLYMEQFELLWPNIVGELHGVVFDVIILGILFGYFDRLREKNYRIRRHIEEINDNRAWKNVEAGFKAVGNIRRLNRLKVVKFDLNEYHLAKSKFNSLELQDSYLSKANMKGCKIEYSTFERCTIVDTDATNVMIQHSQMISLYASGVDFTGAFILNTMMADACISSCNFKKANIANVNMSGSVLIGSTFKGATLYRVDLTNCIGLTPEMLMEAKTTEGLVLDKDLKITYERMKAEMTDMLCTERQIVA